MLSLFDYQGEIYSNDLYIYLWNTHLMQIRSKTYYVIYSFTFYFWNHII